MRAIHMICDCWPIAHLLGFFSVHAHGQLSGSAESCINYQILPPILLRTAQSTPVEDGHQYIQLVWTTNKTTMCSLRSIDHGVLLLDMPSLIS